LTKPLQYLLHKYQPWDWGTAQQTSFENLQDRLLTAPILTRPDFDKDFILQTDWSGIAIGAVLAQLDEDGREQVVAYWSRGLNACGDKLQCH
jgi:hypothetical protein